MRRNAIWRSTCRISLVMAGGLGCQKNICQISILARIGLLPSAVGTRPKMLTGLNPFNRVDLAVHSHHHLKPSPSAAYKNGCYSKLPLC